MLSSETQYGINDSALTTNPSTPNHNQREINVLLRILFIFKIFDIKVLTIVITILYGVGCRGVVINKSDPGVTSWQGTLLLVIVVVQPRSDEALLILQ